MSRRPLRLMLDANVWLDCFLPRRGRQDVAWALVDEALRRKDELLYATETAKDVFFNVARALKAEEREASGGVSEEQAAAINEAAWGIVDFMSDVATAVGAEQSEVRLAHALKPAYRDFEDDLLVATTLRAEADCLVTGDEALIRHAPVVALSPEDALAALRAGAL